MVVKPTKIATNTIVGYPKLSKIDNQLIGFDEARVMLWQIMNNRLALENKNFIKVEKNLPIITELIKYFIKDPTGKLSQRKSIYLFGPIGSGKDFILTSINIMLKKIDARIGLQEANCTSLFYEIKENEKQLSSFFTGNYLFEELGKEPKTMYNDLPIMETILSERHRRCFRNPNLRTIVTTNYPPHFLGQLYSAEIEDKAKQLFNFIFFDGKSLR